MNNIAVKYYLNRVDLMRNFKAFREDMERIVENGIKDENDEKIAIIACTILASDYRYEDLLMSNKSGDYRSSLEPPL